jgi:hypothetical protein
MRPRRVIDVPAEGVLDRLQVSAVTVGRDLNVAERTLLSYRLGSRRYSKVGCVLAIAIEPVDLKPWVNFNAGNCIQLPIWRAETMDEQTRFGDVKEMCGFLRDLKATNPDYKDWDTADDGGPDDVNMDVLFDPVRLSMSDKAAFFEDDAGNVLSFAIINVSHPMPAIHSVYTPGPHRRKRYGQRLVEDCVRHIVAERGRVQIYYDEESDGSTRIKERLPDGLGNLLVDKKWPKRI